MRWIVLPSMIGCLMMPAPLLAHTYTGRAVPQYDRAKVEGAADAIESQQAIYDYGACLAKARRQQVERYLAMAPTSGSARSLARQMTMTACLDAGEFRFDPEAIRGPFYQALYRIDFRDPPASNFNALPPLDYSQGGSAGSSTSDVMANLRRFADCVVREDPASARSLAFSGVGSAEERAAFNALKPEMEACVAPGDKIAFKQPLLRSVFNEMLYRLSTASVGRPMSMDRK